MRFEVYCDESNPDLLASTRSSARFLVIGSLWLPATLRARCKAEIDALRNRNRFGGELKWNKVSPSRESGYRDLVRWFFDQGDDLRFRCITVDRDQVDLKLYHQGDQELGFYKFYYQLLHHWILDFDEYSIFTDYKFNRWRDRLPVLHKCLGVANRCSVVHLVQAVRSEESVLIQLADVLTGAVAARLNTELIASRAKAGVVRELESRLGHRLRPTPRAEQKFNQFQIDFRGGW